MRHVFPQSIRFASSMLTSMGLLIASWTPLACTPAHEQSHDLFHLTSHSDTFPAPGMMPEFNDERLTDSGGLVGVLDYVLNELLSIENMFNADVVNFFRNLDGVLPASVKQEESGPIGLGHAMIGHNGTTLIADSSPRSINTHNIVPASGIHWNPPHFNIDNDQSYLSPWVEHANTLTGPYSVGLGNTIQVGAHDIIGDSPWRNAGQNSADAAQVAFSGNVSLGENDIVVGNYTTYGHGVADSIISSCAGMDSCTGGTVQIGSNDDIGFNPQIGQFPWNVVNGVAIESTNSSKVGTGADIIGPHISIGNDDIIGNHVQLLDLDHPAKFINGGVYFNPDEDPGNAKLGHTGPANPQLSMRIGNNVTIYGDQFGQQGGNYTILSGNIDVDHNAMIGAGSQIINTDPDSVLTIGIDDIIGMDSAISSSLNTQDWVSSHVIVAPDVHLGTGVFLGQADQLDTGSHIGDDVYLPPGVTVASGVTIGAYNTLPASIFTPGTVIDTDIAEGAYVTPLTQALPSGPETVTAVDLTDHATEELKVSESLVQGAIPITMQTGSLNDPDLLAQVNASVKQVGFLELDNDNSGSSSSSIEGYQEIPTNASTLHPVMSHLPADESLNQSATTQDFDQFLQAWEDLVPNMGQQSFISLLGGHGPIGNFNLASLSIVAHDQPAYIGSSLLGIVPDQGLEGFVLHNLKGLSLIDNSSMLAHLFESADKDFSDFNADLWKFETHSDADIISAETSLLKTLFDGHLTDPWADWIGRQLDGFNMLLDGQDQFFNSIVGFSDFTPNDLTRQLLITGLPMAVSADLLSNGDIGGIEGFIDQDLAADIELVSAISDL